VEAKKLQPQRPEIQEYMNETEWMACTNPWQIYAEDGFDQL
jgi:hypothetical protein